MNICYNVSKEHKHTALNLTLDPVKNMGVSLITLAPGDML